MAFWKVETLWDNISKATVCELKVRLRILQTVNKKVTVLDTKKALNKKTLCVCDEWKVVHGSPWCTDYSFCWHTVLHAISKAKLTKQLKISQHKRLQCLHSFKIKRYMTISSAEENTKRCCNLETNQQLIHPHTYNRWETDIFRSRFH